MNVPPAFLLYDSRYQTTLNQLSLDVSTINDITNDLYFSRFMIFLLENSNYGTELWDYSTNLSVRIEETV